MRVSVIISTFDSPRWLENALWGYACQTRIPWEVIVADDGSGPETLAVVRRHREVARRPLVHVWQPHRGFRKCGILNRAIEQATGDYLVFSDGDCIPRADFVATHADLARPGHALSGGCIRLPLAASHAGTRDEIVAGTCMEPDWLRRHGVRGVRTRLRLRAARGPAGWLLDRCTPTRPSFNGHNASAWRADVIRVNGFDERMEYGGLDRELAERLVHAGVRFRHVRHRAICLHLEHSRAYVNEASWARNRAIRRDTRRGRLDWTPFGIVQDGAAAAGRAAPRVAA
jgi:glycosyltransferase involved in cell wall biosynthesis